MWKYEVEMGRFRNPHPSAGPRVSVHAGAKGWEQSMPQTGPSAKAPRPRKSKHRLPLDQLIL